MTKRKAKRTKLSPILSVIVLIAAILGGLWHSGNKLGIDFNKLLSAFDLPWNTQQEPTEPIDVNIIEINGTQYEIPEFNGTPYVEFNGNVPLFTDADMTTESYETYADLDYLGRCGETMACIGRDLMPTEDRESISHIKPTGWINVKYDFISGKDLYNRCHLIGFQLTGENANEQNLITGTRYMNVDGMLPFENMVADYIKDTGNHVLYRVTPIFQGSELVARGVLMEAKSVEDNGAGVLFCVYVYNNQPGVEIDYLTGESKAA